MKCVLVFVLDKINLVFFVKGLEEYGYEIVFIGGIKKVLDEVGIKMILIEDVIYFLEILDGWVKIFNFYVYGGLLVWCDLLEYMKILEDLLIILIDLVCVNFYFFKEMILKLGVELVDVIENIDIGGLLMVCLVVKNY